MAHVSNAVCVDPGNCRLLAISSRVREKYVGSCGYDKANARQQQQGAAGLVEHGVELLVLVLDTSQQETATCSEHVTVMCAWLRLCNSSDCYQHTKHTGLQAWNTQVLSNNEGNFLDVAIPDRTI